MRELVPKLFEDPESLLTDARLDSLITAAEDHCHQAGEEISALGLARALKIKIIYVDMPYGGLTDRNLLMTINEALNHRDWVFVHDYVVYHEAAHKLVRMAGLFEDGWEFNRSEEDRICDAFACEMLGLQGKPREQEQAHEEYYYYQLEHGAYDQEIIHKNQLNLV